MGYTTEFKGEFACRRREGEHVEAFLKAIEEGDRAALSPLADWLIDQGDPRGEQVAKLARKTPANLRPLWALFGLTEAHAAYLHAFSASRRMRRDVNKAALIPDPIREAAGLPLGIEACYLVSGSHGLPGPGTDDSILDYNRPPQGQPGLWCKWEPSEDRTAIIWNGAEKFYDYLEWPSYLIEHFLEPWGYVLNGQMTWQGEDPDDVGTIVVTDNFIDAEHGAPG
jgi:hypothetical protein